MKTSLNTLFTLASLAMLVSSSAIAQSGGGFDLTWNTIDGGDGSSTGGGYSISGTIGQPDAGVSGGGSFTLVGGFWGGADAGQMPTPRLTITVSAGNIVICWPSASAGFVLQESTSLTAPNWTVVVQTPVDNGTTKCVTLTAGSGTKFFRLKRT